MPTGAALLVALAIVGCSSTPLPPERPSHAGSPAKAPSSASSPLAPKSDAVARTWDEYKVAAARRLVEANPSITYMSKPPEPLLGIPVIEIEVDAEGRVRGTQVLREPSEAKQVTAIALRAIRKAAPFGDASRLPKPWKFVEVFLFDGDEHFKPATLDR